jgi:predicted permease
MSFWRQLTHGLRVLTRRTAADEDLGDEVEHYLEQATAAHVARGLSPSDARRAARLEIGNVTTVREEVRSHGWENVIGSLLADLRYAGRMLRKSPVFTLVVVSVIALGTGAVTTVFSAMNALVLRPLPGANDGPRLVFLERKQANSQNGISASHPYYEYLRDRSRTLAGVAAWSKVALTISAGEEGVTAYGNLVSGNYFTVLGTRPALGRFFAPEEDRTPLTHPVIVISHAFWRTRLNADTGVIGRTVAVNGHPFTVIGVAPAEFRGIYTPIVTDAWVPLMMRGELRPEIARDLGDPSHSWLQLFGRLSDGVSSEAAARELSALTAARATDATEPAGWSSFNTVRLSPMTGLPEDASSAALGFMALLLGAAALVLLIASVNVASMLSARAIARRREMAVRAALGAGRGRLVRQLLTEILVLFVLGALGGVLLTVLATSALERLPIPADLTVALELSPDLRVFGFALIVSLLTGLAFGLPPALKAVRNDITARLRDDAPGSGVRRGIITNVLIVGQLSLSLVLLVAAGLFLRALNHGARVDPGFDANGVATIALNAESWGYDEAKARAFYRRLREDVAALPGVTAVSYTMHLPLTMQNNGDNIQIDGVVPPGNDPAAGVPVWLSNVDADYFAALRIPLLAGRDFTRADDDRAPGVAVVNETFARRYWPDGSAIGRAFSLHKRQVTIVGIARNAKYSSLSEAAADLVYFPLAQFWSQKQTMLVRTAGNPALVVPGIQRAVRAIDPGLPRPAMITLRDANSIVLLPQRVAAIVTGALGAVGLLLASVGLYGIIAYSVSRRTREIGIRLALGARGSGVVGMIVREGMRLAGIGVVVGLLLAAGGTRLIAAFLFSVSPLDAVTFGGMSLLFVVVALVASYLPARRAADSDPMTILRAE